MSPDWDFGAILRSQKATPTVGGGYSHLLPALVLCRSGLSWEIGRWDTEPQARCPPPVEKGESEMGPLACAETVISPESSDLCQDLSQSPEFQSIQIGRLPLQGGAM